MKKVYAFTLAEILIILGVIGVIVAITIPVLNSNFKKKQMETQIKVTYTTLAQAILRAEQDGVNSSSFDMTNRNMKTIKTWYNTAFSPYLTVNKVCFDVTPRDCWHQVYGLGKYSVGGPHSISNDEVQFILQTGAAFTIRNYGASWIEYTQGVKTDGQGVIIYFDVNGKAKPNIIGKDVHIAVWTDKGLVPAYNDLTQAAVDKNCLKLQSGYGCLKKIMQEGWVIPDVVWKS